MLDRAFRLTLRDLSTYFLVAAVIFVPLHVVHAFAFQDVIAVTELHDQIAELGENETVRRVGPGDLDMYRLTGLLVLLLEILALPLLASAGGQVLDQRSRGELPSVRAAWAKSTEYLPSLRDLTRPGALLTSFVLAVAIGILARMTGSLIIEPLSDRTAWAGVALVEAGARSLAAPFVMVPAALAASTAKERGVRVPNNT